MCLGIVLLWFEIIDPSLIPALSTKETKLSIVYYTSLHRAQNHISGIMFMCFRMKEKEVVDGNKRKGFPGESVLWWENIECVLERAHH